MLNIHSDTIEDLIDELADDESYSVTSAIRTVPRRYLQDSLPFDDIAIQQGSDRFKNPILNDRYVCILGSFKENEQFYINHTIVHKETSIVEAFRALAMIVEQHNNFIHEPDIKNPNMEE